MTSELSESLARIVSIPARVFVLVRDAKSSSRYTYDKVDSSSSRACEEVGKITLVTWLLHDEQTLLKVQDCSDAKWFY